MPTEHATATPLPMYAFLAVEGARAVDFLQGQLCCDMREAGAGRVLSGAWCTVKGRVVASMLVWRAAEHRVLLRLHADLATDTAMALSRYGALSRVKIAPAAPSMLCIGLLGEGLRDALPALLGRAPIEGLQACAIDDALLVQRDKSGSMFELWLPRDSQPAWQQRLGTWAAGSEQDWRRALVLRSLAEVQAATRDVFLPQMLDYDSDGTVSFRKGCYTGQEIIARTHYKGSVKRRLARLEGEAGPCPAPGSELRDANRALGTVVESAALPGGGCVALAVIAEDFAAHGPAELHSANGAALRAAR